MALHRLGLLGSGGSGTIVIGQAVVSGALSDATAIEGALADDDVVGAVESADDLTGALSAATSLAGEIVDTDIEGTVT